MYCSKPIGQRMVSCAQGVRLPGSAAAAGLTGMLAFIHFLLHHYQILVVLDITYYSLFPVVVIVDITAILHR